MAETRKWSEPLDAPQTEADLQVWVTRQLNAKRPWLLAHADDGVIWGRLGAKGLITSHALAPRLSPPLRLVTLQQLFIFGADDEARLWRDENGWLARRVSDAEGAEAFDEEQILWGDTVVNDFPVDGFTHVREAKQRGMDHIVPRKVTNTELKARQLRLCVRHFIDYDEQTGEARVALSRLTGVEIK
ncbi:MAG: TIGR03984 family CRISPR-associated protein [Acidobacteria bacterium]|nr:TIGR03984 family CRISPR-associated protein [Acidobacteriota bacterium]